MSRRQMVQQQEVRTQEVTSEQSMTLMKNLIRTAVSSICYLRNLLPEDCFQEKKMTDITVKTIKPGSHPQAALIIQWLERGVFDALTRGYLDSIVFAVLMPTPDPTEEPKLIESYHFRVNYSGGQPSSMELMKDNHKKHAEFSKEAIKTATCRMIRTLVVLAQTLNTLPNNRILTLKLQYRDEYTPVEYQPQFFRAAEDGETLEFTETPLKLRVGNISTPFHEMSLKLKTISDSADGGTATESRFSKVQTEHSNDSEQKSKIVESAGIESGDESNQETQNQDEVERNYAEISKLLEPKRKQLETSNIDSTLRGLAEELPHLSRRTIKDGIERFRSQMAEPDLGPSLAEIRISATDVQSFIDHVQQTQTTCKQALLETFSDSVIEDGFKQLQAQGLAKKAKNGRWTLLKPVPSGIAMSKVMKRKMETGELSLSQVSNAPSQRRKTSIVAEPLRQEEDVEQLG